MGKCIGGHDTGSDDYKAATFMHELGHNLNLKHGGSADNPNCKPNYISVMNYAFQFPTYASSRLVDYSHNVIPALNEAALVENNGIGPTSPIGLETAVGHSVPPNTHPDDIIWIPIQVLMQIILQLISIGILVALVLAKLSAHPLLTFILPVVMTTPNPGYMGTTMFTTTHYFFGQIPDLFRTLQDLLS